MCAYNPIHELFRRNTLMRPNATTEFNQPFILAVLTNILENSNY